METIEKAVTNAARGSAAEAKALRVWIIKARRLNPSQYTVEELRAFFDSRHETPTTGPAPTPAGGSGLTAAEVEAIARSVYTPAPRVVTVDSDGTRRELDSEERAHPMLGDVVRWVGSGSNVYLFGPAGSGKTTLAEQVAKVTGREFFADGSLYKESKLMGSMLGSRYTSTPFREAYQSGGLWLLDEVDACDPTTLIILNMALSNRKAVFPDSPRPVAMHPRFRCVATANTVGHGANAQYAGRNPLDGATLDRFARVSVGYDEGLERELGPVPGWTARVQALRAAAGKVPGCLLIISPRASIEGGRFVADCLRDGMAEAEAFAKAEEARIFCGCPRAVRDAIVAAAAA